MIWLAMLFWTKEPALQATTVLMTARVLQSGKVILSGPATTGGVRKVLDGMAEYGVDLTIVDGALSRKSHAAPTITDGLVLSTGAAIAPDLNTVVKKTAELYELMKLLKRMNCCSLKAVFLRWKTTTPCR